MKRTTRCLCLLFGLLMLLGAFAACNGKENATTEQTAGQTTAQTTGRTTEQTAGQTTAQTTGRTTEQTAGQTSEKTTSTSETSSSTSNDANDVTDVVDMTTDSSDVTDSGDSTGGEETTGDVTGAPDGDKNDLLDYVVDDNGNWVVIDSLDYDVIDYSDENGAREVCMLVAEKWAQWAFPQGDGTQLDRLDSAAYLRNLEIESRLGVELNVEYAAGHSAYEAAWTSKLIEMMKNDCALVCGYSTLMAKHGASGYLKNLYQYRYPALEYPWYPDQIDEWSAYDCLFFVAGTSSVRSIAESSCVFYDQALLEDASLEDPVMIAINNEWTLEKMYEYTSAFHDVAVETKDTENPTFGIIASNAEVFYYGMGNRYTTLNNTRDRQRLICLEDGSIERTEACINELKAVLNTDEGRLFYNDEAAHTLLQNRRAAFVTGKMIDITKVSGDTHYAALPIPKRDANQEQYCTITTHSIDVYGIPTSTPDGEMSAVIIEAVFSSDYRDMAPLFFEENVQNRYAKSTDAAAIFDIIRYSRVIDFGWINLGTVRIDHTFKSCLPETKMSDWFSTEITLSNMESAMLSGLSAASPAYRKYK